MRRLGILVTALILMAGCTGDGGREGTGGSGSDPGNSTADGTQIFAVSGVGDSISLIDVVAETEEVFADGFEQVYNLTVIGDALWFGDGEADLVKLDAHSGDELGRVTLPGPFIALGPGDDTMWVLEGFIGVETGVVALDSETLEVKGTVTPPSGTWYSLVAASGDQAWAFGGDPELATSVAQISTDFTQGDSIDTGVIADSMVINGETLWIGGTIPQFVDERDAPGAGIAMVDTGSGEVTDRFPIDNAGEVVVLAAFDTMWASESGAPALIEIDPTTGEETGRVAVGTAGAVPFLLAATSDKIWVFNEPDSRWLSYDPETLEFIDGINVPPLASPPVFAP